MVGEDSKKLLETNQELQSKIDDLENENNCLQGELEKIKKVELIHQQNQQSQLQADIGELNKRLESEQKQSSEALAKLTQEKSDLLVQLGEKGSKESSLLQEVSEMQIYIDNLTE